MKDFRIGTKRYFLASIHAQGKTKTEAFEMLRPRVLDQIKPWIYTANVKGSGRIPKSISEQIIELRNDISRVWNEIERDGNPVSADAFDIDNIPADDGCDDCGKVAELFHDENSGLSLCEDCISKREKPKAKAKSRDEEKRFFFTEWERIMNWIHETANRTGANPIDSLDSLRPTQAAKRMIDAGISARMCLHAMTLHWPEASREMAGVQPMNFLSESENHGDGFHELFGYVSKLATAAKGSDFGIMLIGPAGSGKSRLAKQIAREFRTDAHPDGLPYGETPMTPGATRGDLLGRHTLEGFVPSKFVEIYSGGGVFNFEEMDASDPSMLIVVNNALASGHLFNSVNGQVYEKHDDFIAFATANTFGLGADSKYTGREKLDLATIDRFRMCRATIGLDVSLAEWLMFND